MPIQDLVARAAYGKIYRESHKAEKNNRSRERYKNSHAIVRDYQNRYYRNHRQALRAYQREYRLAHIELHRDRGRIKAHRRRVLEDGSFSINDWRLLVSRSPRCHWCKRPFTKIRKPTLDHVIPLSKGGSHSVENGCCACAECNKRKGAKAVHPLTGQGILL
jgi:5-methylcytosine-specific restriction endonuclease McrA